MGSYICIKKVYNEMEAQIIKGLLETSGIEAQLAFKGGARTLQYPPTSQEISIMVAEEAQDIATEIIAKYELENS